MFPQSLHVLFCEGYRCISRTSKFHENLVVASRVESDRDIYALFIFEEEDVPQQDPAVVQAQDRGWLFDEVLGLLYRSRAHDPFGDTSTFSCLNCEVE
jgi:hypothetical protein